MTVKSESVYEEFMSLYYQCYPLQEKKITWQRGNSEWKLLKNEPDKQNARILEFRLEAKKKQSKSQLSLLSMFADPSRKTDKTSLASLNDQPAPAEAAPTASPEPASSGESQGRTDLNSTPAQDKVKLICVFR